MSIPAALRRQRDFSAGQIDPEADRRSDLEIHDKGLKLAENVRATATGAVTRRPGRRAVYFDTGLHDLIRPISTQVFDVTFAPGRFTARLLNGGIVGNITGCPWTADILPLLSWVPVGRRIYVAARGMPPQFIEYDPVAGSWSLYSYEFQLGADGRISAPFHRFAALGVTLMPSARTGSITLTTSADVFLPGHVGVAFTYMDRQLRVTAVAGPRSATAEVIEELPPTYRVTLDSVDGFAPGETVEGVVSNTVGEVVAVGVSAIDVVVTNNFSGFNNDEVVVAANGRGKVSGQSAIAPGAILQWREQFMSALRGWPGSVAYEVQRLVFCDFPQFEEAIIWSAIGAEQDLETTSANADAAIFTYVPKACRVYQVIGGADLFVLTDAGVFYMPVSESTPFTQGNARFRPITATEAANVRAVFADDAVIFVGAEVQRLFAIIPTGQTSQPYRVAALSDFHAPLFSGPISIAVGEGSEEAPGRHLYVVNSDGSVVVGLYREGQDYVGWFPWRSTGDVLAVAARFGVVLFTVRYPAADVVEALDNAHYLDGSVTLSDFSGNDAIQTSTGEAIQTSAEENIVTEAGALIPFAGVTMFGWADGFFLGEITIDAEGRVDFPTGYTDRVVGWLFEPVIEPFIPTFEGGEAYGQATRRRKIKRVLLTYRDSTTFTADGHPMGREFASYKVGEDMGVPRPLRDETQSYRRVGRSYDPSVVIRQPVPGPLTLIEITTEVTI